MRYTSIQFRSAEPQSLRLSAIHCHEQVVERLRQRWVRVSGISQRGVWQLPHHRGLKDGHDLPAFDAENRWPENLVVVRIHDGFHESPGLIHFERAGDRRHGKFCYMNLAPLRSSLGFGQADATQLRVDEKAVWH